MIEAGRESGVWFESEADPGVAEAIEADLLRRSGQFDKVAMTCRVGLEKGAEGLVAEVLSLEETLASRQDAGAHTVAEVVGEDRR